MIALHKISLVVVIATKTSFTSTSIIIKQKNYTFLTFKYKWYIAGRYMLAVI